MSDIVTLQYDYYPDPTKGRPVFYGSIYVGEPDTDPTLEANQKTISIIQEDGTVVPVSQPVTTSAGGVPQYNGSPVRIQTEGTYSLAVLNNLGVQVYYLNQSQLISAENVGYDNTDSGLSADNVQDAIDEISGNAEDLAPLASPEFTGDPTAPTPDEGDSSTKIATTEFVSNAVYPVIDKSFWPTVSVNASDNEHDIDFSSGIIIDTTGLVKIELDATTKQIDATWSAGDGFGGLFDGASLAADSTIYCFVIVKDDDGTVDAGFDDNSTADNIPAGYMSYRRIAKFRLDGSSNIIPFHQRGDYFYFDGHVLDLDTTSTSTTRTNVSVSVPDGAIGLFGVNIQKSSTSYYVINSTYSDDASPSGTTANANVGDQGEKASLEMMILVDDNGEISYRSSVSSVSYFRIWSNGWIDQRFD